MNNQTITLSKFLSRYLGLSGEQLKNITHEDAKLLFPNLKRTSFERMENDEEFMSENDVALVYDGKKTIPYIIPKIVNDDYQEIQCEIIDDKIEIDNNTYDYSKLSVYQLKQLLRRACNSYRNQRMAKLELENRGIIKKKYCRTEFKNYNE